MTIEKRAEKYADTYVVGDAAIIVDIVHKVAKEAYLAGATEQEEIDEADPSDAVIMRVLNAIGYEEESWIPFVRKNLKKQ